MLEEKHNKNTFMQMLENVIEKLDVTLLEDYFSTDFELESNRCLMTLGGYRDHLMEAFDSLKSIEVKRPLSDIIIKDDRIATRFSMDITDSLGICETADIIAIIKFKQGKIIRWWELSYPDWQTD